MRSTIDVTARLAAFPDIVHRLAISPVFGIPTRPAVEACLTGLDMTGLALVYFDIDQLKAANEHWGKVESSRRIAAALHVRSTDILIGQWYSGDEFVAVLPAADAAAYAAVLLAAFQAQGMSATFVIIEPVAGESVLNLADRADGIITTMKTAGLRGTITIC